MRGRAACVALIAAWSVGCKKEKHEVPVVPLEQVVYDVGAAPSGSPAGERPTPAPPPRRGPLREVEPNENRAQATPLPINGGLVGRLGSDSPEDWFVIELKGAESRQLRLQLGPEEGGDLALEWMATEPGSKGDAPLAVIDGARENGSEVLPPTVLPPGRHYFRVVAGRPPRSKRGKRRPLPQPAERPYRLTTTVVDPEVGLEIEPNDTHAAAGILRPGEKRSGYLGWNKDTDWYRLDLSGAPPEGRLRVDLSPIPGVKARLRLLDRRRKPLVTVPEAKVPWNPGLSATVRDLGLDGTSPPLYVEVRALRGANPHDRYEISAQVEVPQSDREKEPNWRPADSAPLLPDHPVDGFIGHPTDWDVFRIDSETPRVATVVVSGVAGVDLELEHIDSARKVVSTVNELGEGGQETLSAIQVGPQPAFVRVRSRSFGYNVERGYRIAVTLSDGGDQEVEPNNALADAGKVHLPIGKPFTGHIHPRGDIDHFALDVTTPTTDETRILTVRLTGVEGLRLGLFLFDADGALIAKKTGGPAGGIRTLTHGFEAGRYVIRVVEETGQAANATLPYTLEISE